MGADLGPIARPAPVPRASVPNATADQPHRRPAHPHHPSRRPDLPIARKTGGRVVAVLGPTNTGKTHYAIERMLGHPTGVIGLPLRLLAREIYDRIVVTHGPAKVALVTGEERIVPPQARFFVCTVEAMPPKRDDGQDFDFLAVDEIQLCADPERGHVFTDRLLRARGRYETLFLGAETMRPVIRALLPDAEFVTRPRFSSLTWTGPKKLGRLPRRSAIVGFSAEGVYGIAELIRRQRGGAAVVLGALSPRTRNAQVQLYQSGEVDFLVATDAIGMGLNMDVDHVAFAGLRKFDGHHFRPLGAVEVAQIAGRAGRHMNDGSFGTTGEAEMPDAGLIEQIENHRFDPVRVLQWRNPELDFGSLNGLIRGLEAPPPARGLIRARDADDLITLKILSRDHEVARLAAGRAGLHRLWQVCQIPDFRKVSMDEHVRLLGHIYRHLSGPTGVLDEDWVAAQVARLDRVEGEVDTLSGRLAHIRTWTYISHRAAWLKHAAHWQERTRAIEDRLSDALHARLTQRFVDRRTAVLMRRLRQRESLIASVSAEGEVLVEGEFVGRLDGFRFVADPRAEGVHERTLRHAGLAALQSEIAQRADALAGAADADIRLTDSGILVWRGAQVAKLGAEAARAESWLLGPTIALLHDDLLSAAARDRVSARLRAWLDARIAADLDPLCRLRAAEGLAGLARGIAFRLAEAHGIVDRPAMDADLRGLSKADRAALRRLGVRFGQRHVFLPAVLKPAAARLKLLLWAGARGLSAPPPPLVPAGTTSLPIAKYSESIASDEVSATAALRLQGFVVLGPRAVRVDMVEKLLDRLRAFHDAAPFVTPPEPAMELGCQPAELHGILRALGYRPVAGEDGVPLWRAPKSVRRIKPLQGQPHVTDSPFARLRDLIPA